MQSTKDMPKPITSTQPSNMQLKKVPLISDLCGMNSLQTRTLSA
jgi:hypothetical protein